VYVLVVVPYGPEQVPDVLVVEAVERVPAGPSHGDQPAVAE
jgi:hypothetical protein